MLLAHEIEAARRERRLLICRTIIAVFLPISSKGRVHLQGTRIPRLLPLYAESPEHQFGFLKECPGNQLIPGH